jgi:hypothetical protein
MSTKAKLVLKNNKKLGKIYNPDTMLVFDKAGTDKLVIGRIDGDEFVSLDEQAISLCKEHDLKYDTTLCEEAEEEEQGAEEEQESEEAQEEPEEPEQEEEKEEPKKPVKETKKPEPKKSEPVESKVSHPALDLDSLVKSFTASLFEQVQTKETVHKQQLSDLEAKVQKLEKEYDTLKKKYNAMIQAMAIN